MRKKTKNDCLTSRYKAECKIISKLLFEKDPVGINFEDNTDEYDSEAAMILGKLNTCKNVQDVKKLVYNVFMNHFDKETAGPIEIYTDLAEELYKMFLQDGSKT